VASVSSILTALYTAIEAVSPVVEPALSFRRWRHREADLDQADLPDRLRAFTWQAGTASPGSIFSQRAGRLWFTSNFSLRVGYVSAQESARDTDADALGYEGMADADTPRIVRSVLFGALAGLSDVVSPVYLSSTPSGGRSVVHSFNIQWAEVP
jgi:hypothetical protein